MSRLRSVLVWLEAERGAVRGETIPPHDPPIKNYLVELADKIYKSKDYTVEYGNMQYRFSNLYSEGWTIRWKDIRNSQWNTLNPGWGVRWVETRPGEKALLYSRILVALTAIHSGIELWRLNCGLEINSGYGHGLIR